MEPSAVRQGEQAAWTAKDEDGGTYAALFNLGEQETLVSVELGLLGMKEAKLYPVRDVWEREDLAPVSGKIEAMVPGHGCRLYKITE
ncbi:hypothetical protein [Paenibacillus rigui]|uniref:hypothetical protein n=1 Tax=Paenibacillus rigui TaxID=554312 RepID=UPI0015C5CE57|nr:hypothetical protein [Paenibacillus rigui]